MLGRGGVRRPAAPGVGLGQPPPRGGDRGPVRQRQVLPDRRLQVAYRGGPLYTFAQDVRAGDVKGNGFKDVGVWRPATVSAPKAPPPATTTSGGYGP